jgi:hypothetical protein
VSARDGEPRGSAPRSCGSGRKRNCKRAWKEMARRRCRDCCGRRERCRAPPQPWAPRKLRCRVLTRGSQSQTHALWAQVAAPERKDGVGGGTEGRELFHMRAATRGGMSVDIHCAALDGEPQRSGQCAEQGRTAQRRAEQSGAEQPAHEMERGTSAMRQESHRPASDEGTLQSTVIGCYSYSRGVSDRRANRSGALSDVWREHVDDLLTPC